jgi:YNFM family putative membrane transporter
MSHALADTSAISAQTHRSIVLLSCATFASMATQRICDAMLPELSRVFEVTLAQAAQVVSMFSVVYGLAQLLHGPLGDRYGKFRLITLATLACSMGSVLSALANSLDGLVLARVISAFCAAAIIPLSMAWVGDVVPYEMRQETLAKTGFGTTTGLVGGQLMGGLLTDTLGWRWAFVFLTLIYAVVGLLLWRDLREQQRVARQRQPSTQQAALSQYQDEAVSTRPGFVAQALLIVTGPWSRWVLLASLLEGAAGFGILAICASHLHENLGLSLTAAGAIMALFGVGGVAYMALARHLIRRLGERGLSLVGGLVLGLSFMVLGLATHWQWAMLASLVAGFAFFMLHNTLQANATQMAPAARGTAVSLFASSLFMGQAIGVLLAAHLTSRWGSGTVIAMGGAVLVLVGGSFSQALKQREQLLGQS